MLTKIIKQTLIIIEQIICVQSKSITNYSICSQTAEYESVFQLPPILWKVDIFNLSKVLELKTTQCL